MSERKRIPTRMNPRAPVASSQIMQLCPQDATVEIRIAPIGYQNLPYTPYSAAARPSASIHEDTRAEYPSNRLRIQQEGEDDDRKQVQATLLATSLVGLKATMRCITRASSAKKRAPTRALLR